MPADGDRFPGERIVVTAFVIEHPRGVFLFDTGFSPEPRKMVDLYRPVYMRPIHEALRAAGHGITDVKLVANCHFHADHAGGNRHFTRTPIFVQKRELAHARKESDYTHHPTSPIFPAPRWKRSMERPSPGPASTSCPRPDTRPATSRSSSIRKRAATFWPDKR
jgi:glyoxylase-like metal-dependent hydrolase (beta-lactamase superfamily II)